MKSGMVEVKMTLEKLRNLSYDKAGDLQVRKEKETGVWIFYYHSSPQRGTVQRNLVCCWSRGTATLPVEWLAKIGQQVKWKAAGKVSRLDGVKGKVVSGKVVSIENDGVTALKDYASLVSLGKVAFEDLV